jgi:magnesium-protoporphyrin O-methyltransferase
MGGPPGERLPGRESGCCEANEFGEATARRELRAYRKAGPPRTTTWLIDGLREGGIEGMTVLDIGAGVGAVYLELLASGAASATDIDGSPAFVAASRDEAERRGVADRVRYEVGDFVALAPETQPADLVVLDRVVCCYPDMESLVRLSVAHARRRYGLVYPRDSLWMRAGTRVMNAFARLIRQKVRAHIHRTAAVDSLVRSAGFAPRFNRSNLFWQVVVYERSPA